MLELSLIGVIGLAAIYWTALWWMGRQEDVLYGDFVSSEGTAMLTAVERSPRPQPAPTPAEPRTRHLSSLTLPSTLPATQSVPQQSVPQQSLQHSPASAMTAARLALPANLTAPPPLRSAPLDSATVRPPRASAGATDHHDVLASLLETIKRDLNDAVGKS